LTQVRGHLHTLVALPSNKKPPFLIGQDVRPYSLFPSANLPFCDWAIYNKEPGYCCYSIRN
jgi:hypothetical protein